MTPYSWYSLLRMNGTLSLSFWFRLEFESKVAMVNARWEMLQRNKMQRVLVADDGILGMNDEDWSGTV